MNKEDKKNIREWCKQAIKLGLTKKEVKAKLKGFPRKVRKETLKMFKDLEKGTITKKMFKSLDKEKIILKGGSENMPIKKRKKVEEELDDDYEDDEENNEEDLTDEEDDEELVPKKRGRPSSQNTSDELAPSSGKPKPWKVRVIPQIYQIFDPNTGQIIAETTSPEELQLNLQVIATQHSIEAAANTR